jgi:hypothetical protein
MTITTPNFRPARLLKDCAPGNIGGQSKLPSQAFPTQVAAATLASGDNTIVASAGRHTIKVYVSHREKRRFLSLGRLIRMAHPTHRGRMVAMLFRSYFDDSEDGGTRLFGVGGFVGHDDVWDELEAKWLDALPSEIEYFHATDCFSGNNQFEPKRGFPRERRVELLEQLTDLVCQTDVKLICWTIDAPIYERFAPKRIENVFLGNKYRACFENCLRSACADYMQPLDERLPIDAGDLCAIFYEESDYTESVVRCVRGPATIASFGGEIASAIRRPERKPDLLQFPSYKWPIWEFSLAQSSRQMPPMGTFRGDRTTKN